MSIRFTPLCSALLLALPCVAIAQEASNARTLSAVSVTEAKPRADLLPANAKNSFRTPESSSNHTQTITREEIEQLRPRDVFELLNSATGVIATQGSRKGFTGLSVRGDSNFRWIIDGAYLQPTMASRILASLPVMAIEEVKVVRGGSALTLAPMVGSASPGGAPVDGFVILRTRKPQKDVAQVRVAMESFNANQGSAWLGKTLGATENKGYIAGVLSSSYTDGSSDKLDNNASYNIGRKSTGGMVKGGFEASGITVDLMAYQDDGRFSIPNTNSHGSPQAVGSWYMDPSQTDILVLSGSGQWNASNTTLFSLSQSNSKQKFWTANTSAGPYTAVKNDNSVTHFNLRHNLDIGATRLVVGGDNMYWNAPNGQQYYEGIQREELTKGLFAQVEQKLVDDRLTLDASVRQDQVYVMHGLDYYTGGAQPPGGVNSKLKTTDKTLAPALFSSLGTSWKLSKDWMLSGRYSQAKQVADSLNPVPGVVLADDEQKKWELGVDGFLSTLLSPSLNFFHREVKNEKSVSGFSWTGNVCKTTGVSTTAVLTPCYTQADTTREGVELAVNGAFLERSSYRASVTHFTSLSTNVEKTTPVDIVDVSISHGMGRYTLTGAVKQVSAYRGSATDVNAYLGGYTRVDLGLGYDFRVSGTPVKATLYGRNLTDQHYETNNGVQDVGRVLGLELMASF